MDTFDLITPPVKTALSLAQAKLHLKVDSSAEDTDIAQKMRTAQREVEKIARRVCLTQTYLFRRDDSFYADGGGSEIEFSKAPLQRVNSVKYLGLQDALDPTYDSAYDPASKLHTMKPALYQVKISSETGRLSPITTIWWPYTRLPILGPVYDAVQIELVAGYSDDPLDIPDNMISAMLLMLTHLYENRSSVITGLRAAAVEVPQGIYDLLWSERVVRFA